MLHIILSKGPQQTTCSFLKRKEKLKTFFLVKKNWETVKLSESTIGTTLWRSATVGPRGAAGIWTLCQLVFKNVLWRLYNPYPGLGTVLKILPIPSPLNSSLRRHREYSGPSLLEIVAPLKIKIFLKMLNFNRAKTFRLSKNTKMRTLWW